MFTEKEMSDALKWLFDLFQPEDYEAYDEEEVGCAALCLPEVCMALRDKAETPYEYVVKTNIDRGFEYRGKELFMQRACLIYSDMEIGIYDMTDTSYNRELWLLEDMSFALVHNVSMVIKSGDFSPEIRWDHCTFEYKGMSFGVIYTEPLLNKPCICKKSYDAPNPKYTLKEGDIFYRYGGRSERIRYEELSAIIDHARKVEEQLWLNFAQRAAKVGIENACLLDLGTGKITGNGGSIVIDENLLSKIAFIKEGEFVETKGKPAIRLIGDIENVSTGKIVVRETTRKVVKAIEPNDLIKAFLKGINVEDPLEYIRAVCSATTGNYPIYFLLQQANASINDAIKTVEDTTARGAAKKSLRERLDGKRIVPASASVSKSSASIKKSLYREAWRSEKVVLKQDELTYCITALLSLSEEDIKKHEQYIKSMLLEIFEKYYEKASSILASNIRKAICRVDEVLFLNEQ